MSIEIDQVIALTASIGACLSAIAAFLAVRQSLFHAKASYKPELVIAKAFFKCNSEGSIINEWMMWTKEKEEKDTQKLLTLPLSNVGLGAAKEVNISWSFPIEDMVSNVNTLAQKSLTPAYFEYSNGVLALKSDTLGKNASFWKNQKNISLDFVLPAPVDQVPVELSLPFAFTQLVSALVCFSAKIDDLELLSNIPKLKAVMKYSDIGGTKHRSVFEIETNINMITNKGHQFEGSLVSSCA